MNNLYVVLKLDDVATEIRKILEIPDDFIVNHNFKEELIKRIPQKFESFKIEADYGMSFTLTNGKDIFITYDKNEMKKGEVFEYVTRAFLYGILLDKRELNYYQLQEYHVPDYTILNDEYVDCLFKAFLLPRKQFYKEMVKYTTGDGSRCDVETMSKKLENKHVISRGRDLKLW